MGKDKKKSSEQPKAALVAEPTAFDPSLAALFSSSSGPVTISQKPARSFPPTSTTQAKPNGTTKTAQTAEDGSSDEDDEVAQAVGESDSESTSESEVEGAAEVEEVDDRPRKRRRVNQNDDLESKYLDKLVREEEQEIKQRKKKEGPQEPEEDDISVSDSDLNSDLQDVSDSEPEMAAKDDDIPKHETQDPDKPDVEADKINRTVFLGNVSINTIKSKNAKKDLILHLRTGLDEKHGEKIESIRFRSTAFVSDAGPKRAAYAKKELMEETTKSTNAYVVVSTDAAARKMALRLNGTTVLDRHLRVDSVGEPAKVDHKRCIFVGNLSFVDEATATDETEEGEKKRKRAREPADVEEGLWRVFGKVGKVESVRVVRDKETRISKGFAYVQFEGENAVEAALLMNEKKFPPMLPRPMRVMRAKKDLSKNRGTSGSGRGGRTGQSDRGGRGRGGSIRGRSAQGRPIGGSYGNSRGGLEGHRASTGSKPAFEGHRATAGSAGGDKKAKKRTAAKPTKNSTKRAAAFKAAGGKKRREVS